jgi:quercetin dioxygenase-like cupin family protein
MSEASSPTTAPAEDGVESEPVHDPLHRVTYGFRREGANLWVDVRLSAGGHLPEHFHPSLEERWQVLDGRVRLKLAGEWRDVVPEDGPMLVRSNVRHELKNLSGREAHLRAEVIPAGRLQEFLVESARAARDGLYNARNLPTGFRGATWMAEFALRFRDETVMCSPPPALQRILLPPLARLAR